MSFVFPSMSTSMESVMYPTLNVFMNASWDASESGRLRHGDGDRGRGDRRRKAFMLTILQEGVQHAGGDM